MSMAQIVAVIIFIGMFVLIVLDKIEKQYVTLGCALLTLVLVFGLIMHSGSAIMDSLNIQSMFMKSFWYEGAGAAESSSGGISWSTILFLLGMMVMVEGMTKAGFFRWLCLKLAKMVNYKPVPLFIVFMIMSAVLSMFISSITVILFLAAVSIELAKLLKIDPVPMILAEIFCANLGGAASMCGDPPNIIIGTALGYTFTDFLLNTGFIALIGLVAIVIYFYLIYRKEFQAESNVAIDASKMPDPKSAITNKTDFRIACAIFLCALVLLITHAQTGLTIAFIGVFVGIVTLIAYARYAKEMICKLDYKTLLFFVGLFVVVDGLEQTGVLTVIAGFIKAISGGNTKLMVAIILWLSAVASAFVDNIPFAATMLPVIKSLAASGGNLPALAWALSMGTDVGGSATPIGASANVVGMSLAGKSGYKIGWGKYCRDCAPATIIVVTISMLIIFARYC